MARSKQPPSIRLRLLGATLLVLPLFLGLTAWMLDRAFTDYQLTAQRESMRLQQLLLAKAADWDGSNWRFEGLDEARLRLLNSGLYAFVLSPEGSILWRSPSAGQIGQLQDPPGAVGALAQSLGLEGLAVGQHRFDDCQALVKGAMADAELSTQHRFSSANSINIGRLLPQSTYYVDASLRHFRRTGNKPGFIIPTGNLGNAFACIMAREMGLPIGPVVLAATVNEWKSQVTTTIPMMGLEQPTPAELMIVRALDARRSRRDFVVRVEEIEAELDPRPIVSDDRGGIEIHGPEQTLRGRGARAPHR